MEPAARRFLDGLLAAVQDDPRIVGLLLAGSAATGEMDEFSRRRHGDRTRPTRAIPSCSAGAARVRRVAGTAAGRVHRRARRRAAAADRALRPAAAARRPQVRRVERPRRARRGRRGTWERDGLVSAALARSAAVWPTPDATVDRGPFLGLGALLRDEDRAWRAVRVHRRASACIRGLVLDPLLAIRPGRAGAAAGRAAARALRAGGGPGAGGNGRRPFRGRLRGRAAGRDRALPRAARPGGRAPRGGRGGERRLPRGRRQPGGARLEVALLGQARGPARGLAVASRAASASPAISSRCARTAARRWWPASRSSASSVAEQVQPGLRAVDHRHRDGAVERDHRVRRDPLEQLVEREDLRPVGVLGARRLGVHGGDRRLELVRAERRRASALGDQRDALARSLAGPSGGGPARRAAPARRRAGCGRPAARR